MTPTGLIFKKKEIQGILISVYGKIALSFLIIFFTIFIAISRVELVSVIILCLITIGILSYFIYNLKKEIWVKTIAIFSILLDVIIVSGLPFIWYYSVGGDTVPRTYLLKTYTHYIIASAIILNAFTLQPIYPILYSVGVVLGQVGILLYALKDPRFLSTDNFLEAVLGDAVHIENYYMNMAVLIILSFITGYLTYRVRFTILEAAKNEVKADRLSRYFSPNIVSELSKESDSDKILGGKNQEITVIFSDLIGFTGLSEKLGPEKTLELLSEYHEKMLEIVFQNQGTIDKFIGDGMLITFGTPIPNLSDTERAIKTAIQMQKTLKKWSLERLANGLTPLAQRIGIHQGFALVGNIGTKDKLEYTVIGDTINTASRIEAFGKELGKDFLVSKNVLDKLGSDLVEKYKFESLGLKQIRGKEIQIELFSIDIL
jgi:adenylate cyclase